MPTVYLNPEALEQVLTDLGLQDAAEELSQAGSVLEIAMQKGYDALIAHLGTKPLSSFVHGADGDDAPYVSTEWAHADAVPYELLSYRAEVLEGHEPDDEDECEDDDPEESE